MILRVNKLGAVLDATYAVLVRLALARVDDTWRIAAKHDASGAQEFLELQDTAR